MNKFSLENIKNGIKNTLNRFPIPMLVATALTVIGLVLVDYRDGFRFQQIEFTLVLALLLSVAAKLYIETHTEKSAKVTANGLTILLVVSFYFFGAPHLANATHVSETYTIQYFLWIIAGLVGIGFAPAIRKSYTEFHFWKYISRLGGAVVGAFAYSFILFAGLAIAFGAVSFLFGLDFVVEVYARLWIIIAGIVAPMLFLNHIPKLENISAERKVGYPVALKHLAYYILVPLVCIYFTILYVYTAKILITMTWPKGVVSVMILGFSGLGLLVYMILYPIIKETSSFTKAAKIFFILLIPQIVVLFYAVFLRINEYAWTPQRYMVVAGGIWLLLIALYSLVSKIKNLKFFFVSLFIFIVVSSFGPWGMFNVSTTSQVNRLKTILNRNNLIVDGKIQKVLEAESIPFADRREIGAAASYLKQNGSLDRVQDLTTVQLKDDTDLTKAVGISMVYGYEEFLVSSTQTIFAEYSENEVTLVSGYDYSIRDLFGLYIINGNTYSLSLDNTTNQYIFEKNGLAFTTIPLNTFLIQLKKETLGGKNTLPSKLMTYTFENEKIKARILLNSVTTWNDHSTLSGTLLLKIK